MTAMELLAAAKHYWKMCVAIVAACTLAATCLFGFVLKPQYEATSSIIVMDPSGSVATAALTTVVNDCVLQYGLGESDSSITSSVGTGAKSQIVSVTVEKSSPRDAVLVANQPPSMPPRKRRVTLPLSKSEGRRLLPRTMAPSMARAKRCSFSSKTSGPMLFATLSSRKLLRHPSLG